MRNTTFFVLLLPIVIVYGVCAGDLLADVHWSFDLLAQFLTPSFFLAVIVGLIALALRCKWLAAASAAAALSAFALAWPWTQAPTCSR